MLKFQVFEVLVEAWTLRRKTEQIGPKRTNNGILRITEFNLASRRNDISRPSFQTSFTQPLTQTTVDQHGPSIDPRSVGLTVDEGQQPVS
ncbi:hypothetical protein MTR67_034668 [Solanum verrucosum]|uniref:Uncharacterized protein n=1 Tax=Solanum verrucosum TaxID=315347 RepID=A0AAF0ZKN9_SOLVR|nr:hypothetical protein MTR67_034668 [Solanum verrucosum]